MQSFFNRKLSDKLRHIRLLHNKRLKRQLVNESVSECTSKRSNRRQQMASVDSSKIFLLFHCCQSSIIFSFFVGHKFGNVIVNDSDKPPVWMEQCSRALFCIAHVVISLSLYKTVVCRRDTDVSAVPVSDSRRDGQGWDWTWCVAFEEIISLQSPGEAQGYISHKWRSSKGFGNVSTFEEHEIRKHASSKLHLLLQLSVFIFLPCWIAFIWLSRIRLNHTCFPVVSGPFLSLRPMDVRPGP